MPSAFNLDQPVSPERGERVRIAVVGTRDSLLGLTRIQNRSRLPEIHLAYSSLVTVSQFLHDEGIVPRGIRIPAIHIAFKPGEAALLSHMGKAIVRVGLRLPKLGTRMRADSKAGPFLEVEIGDYLRDWLPEYGLTGVLTGDAEMDRYGRILRYEVIDRLDRIARPLKAEIDTQSDRMAGLLEVINEEMLLKVQ